MDLEREASERYKGFVVRNRLKRVSNEAVRCSAFMHKEELCRYSDRYIEFVKSPDGHMLRSNREMRKAFGAHFRDRFARCPDLLVQEFRNYLADFPRLGAAEAASCEGLVTECEVRNALKQVGLNKSPGLDGLPYEVYLRLSHMFVPILTDVFNHWFAQGAIPGSITKGVITLLKKGGRHVWEDLDDYRPITLLNAELKILARVLANRLQLVIRDLIGPEQNYAVKGRSIQDNLHLIREILSPLLYVLALEPLLRRLRDEGARPALRGIPLAGSVHARISAYADDITVFVSSRLDILAVKKAVERYEKVAGAKVNFDKSEGLRLGAWKKGGLLPGPFRWSDGPVHILGVWFGPDLQLERNWSEVRAKVEAQVGAWLRRLSLKGRAEACAVYVLPLILYRLSVLPLPRDHRVALERSLSKLLWRGRRPLVSRKVCCQRPREGGLGMPDLESHWLAERLAYLGRSLTKETVLGHKVRVVFPRRRFNPKAESRRRPKDETRFSIECRRALRNLPRSSDLSWPRRKLYHGLVEGSVSDRLEKRLGSGDSLPMELGARLELLEQLRVLAHLAACP